MLFLQVSLHREVEKLVERPGRPASSQGDFSPRRLVEPLGFGPKTYSLGGYCSIQAELRFYKILTNYGGTVGI